MAENILGGGFIGPAKPFNVLNPSGISAESSLDTLTQVGEGNRNRQAQAGMQQRQLEAQAQAQQAQISAEADQAEKDRALTERKMADETFYRNRTEMLARASQDYQDDLAEINRQLEMALKQGSDTAVQAILVKKQALQAEQAGNNSKLEGLEMLRKTQEGLFSRDMKDPTGRSLGAQMLTGVMDVAESRAAAINQALGTVNPAAERWLSGEGENFGDLATALVTGAAGQALPNQAKVTMEHLLGSLARATDPAISGRPDEVLGRGSMGDFYMKDAKNRYIELAQMGMDTTVLDNLFFHLFNKGKVTGGGAGALLRQKEADQAEGKVSNEKLGPAVAGAVDRFGQLNRMMLALQAMNEGPEDGTATMPGVLLKNWGSSSLFDPDEKGRNTKVQDLVLRTMSMVAGTKDPEDFLNRLANSDPSDDPEGMGFLATLHPEVRTVLRTKFQAAAEELRTNKEDVRKRYPIGGLDVGDIGGLRERQLGITEEMGQTEIGENVKKAAGQRPQVEEAERKRGEAKKKYQRARSDSDVRAPRGG